MSQHQSDAPMAPNNGGGQVPPDGPHKRWVSIGKTFKSCDPDYPDVLKEIQIMEMARSVSMDSTIDPRTRRREPYGQPIDVKFAVHLITRLLNALRKEKVLPVLEEYDELLMLRNAARDETKSSTSGAPSNDQRLQNTPEYDDTMRWLIQLILNSHAITFDKSVLLKTLSQPKCEGVRFYLCLTPHPKEKQRELEKAEADDSMFSDLRDGVLSTVIVGVDCDGHDLNYDEPVDKANFSEGLTTLEDASALGEFGHPPGGGFTISPITNGKPAYTLWDFAIKNFKAGRPAE